MKKYEDACMSLHQAHERYKKFKSGVYNFSDTNYFGHLHTLDWHHHWSWRISAGNRKTNRYQLTRWLWNSLENINCWSWLDTGFHLQRTKNLLPKNTLLQNNLPRSWSNVVRMFEKVIYDVMKLEEMASYNIVSVDECWVQYFQPDTMRANKILPCRNQKEVPYNMVGWKIDAHMLGV